MEYSIHPNAKGVYVLSINNKHYVGKDSNISKKARIHSHMYSLRKGNHYNKRMQEDFNKHGESNTSYMILFIQSDISDEDLVLVERDYIAKYNSLEEGYNELDGYNYSDKLRALRSEQKSGENHHSAKLTNKQFFEIVQHLKEGKTNEQIADIFGLHSRYVSLIRHKKRFTKLWEQVEDYKPKKSNKNKNSRKLDYTTYCKIRQEQENGVGNRKIEEIFGLSSGAASRIKNGIVYKDYFEDYKQH